MSKFARVLLTLSVAILVAACASPMASSSGVAESVVVATPTPEATPRPTPRPVPSPTPEPLDGSSGCGAWELAGEAERLDYATFLLLSTGRPVAAGADLAKIFTDQCIEKPYLSLIDIMNSAVADDSRFARPTPVPTPEPTPVSYAQLDARDWDLLVKTPDAYTGNGYVVWGCIAQFDAATGDEAFLAYSSSTSLQYWFSDGDNALFKGDADPLRAFVEDDVVSMNVISLGSFSYDTQAGGNTTVPMFRVDQITLQGSCR